MYMLHVCAAQYGGVITCTWKPIVSALGLVYWHTSLHNFDYVDTNCITLIMVFHYYFYRFEYHWADGTTVKKPIKCSAPKYIDYLMTWVQEQLDDENIFPSKIGDYDQFVCTLLNVCVC